MGDGSRRSDDEGDEEVMGADDEEDLGDLSEEEEEGSADAYRGGKYRAFHVSKHSLYVRAIARHEDGLKEDRRTDDLHQPQHKEGQSRPPSKSSPVKRSPSASVSASEGGKAKVATANTKSAPPPPPPRSSAHTTVDFHFRRRRRRLLLTRFSRMSRSLDVAGIIFTPIRTLRASMYSIQNMNVYYQKYHRYTA